MPRTSFRLCSLLLLGFVSACDAQEKGDAMRTAVGGAAAPATGRKAPARVRSQVTNQYVRVVDPVENSFAAQMPKGWQNMAYRHRVYEVSRAVTTSTSPDGSTIIFTGDPSMNYYFTPEGQRTAGPQFLSKNPLFKVAPTQTAQQYFPAYAQRKFGGLPGFRIVSTTPDPEYVAFLQGDARRLGVPPPASITNVRFQYQEGGTTVHVKLYGHSSNGYGWWSVSVGGIRSLDDPDKYQGMLFHICNSMVPNPAWQQQEKAMERQRMAAIVERGRRNMEILNGMARRHQVRMDAIRAAGDASMRAYYERDAASDRSQRNFLNYVNDETTVASSSGKTYQVDNSYQRYFVHKGNETYVGGDSTTDLDDLRKMGLDPSEYEEVQVKR